MLSTLPMQIPGRLLVVMEAQSSEPRTVEQTGFHKQAEQQILYWVSALPMQIPEQLLVFMAQSSEPQTPEQTGFHKQAEQQTIYIVSPLPM